MTDGLRVGQSEGWVGPSSFHSGSQPPRSERMRSSVVMHPMVSPGRPPACFDHSPVQADSLPTHSADQGCARVCWLIAPVLSGIALVPAFVSSASSQPRCLRACGISPRSGCACGSRAMPSGLLRYFQALHSSGRTASSAFFSLRRSICFRVGLFLNHMATSTATSAVPARQIAPILLISNAHATSLASPDKAK